MLRFTTGIAFLRNGEWWIRVEDGPHSQPEEELCVGSVHGGIALAEGLYVEFLIGLIEREGKRVPGAIDVRPVQPRPSSEQVLGWVKNEGQEHSILWDVVAKVQEGLGEQALRPDEEDSSLPGGGGQRHRYLQQVTKELGEQLGFKSTIEKTDASAKLRVDVALEREDVAIACEISIANTSGELEKIRKAMVAGYHHVVFLSTERSILRSIEGRVWRRLDPQQQERVHLLLPEELDSFLASMILPIPREETFKGWKVRVQHVSVSPEEAQRRRKVVGLVMVDATRRIQQEQATVR